MDTAHTLKSRLTPYLPYIVFILCVIQPMLDVLSFFIEKSEASNTPTLLLRFAVLGILVIGGFIFSERKRAYFITAAVLALFTAAHSFACMQTGYADLVTDWANLLRIYQLPVSAICFISFMRASDRVYPTLKKALLCCLGIIMLVQLLSYITGTDPHTYARKEIGLLGWFSCTNSQSAILSTLVPLVTVLLIKRFDYKALPTLIVTMLTFSVLFFFATRLAYFALFVTGVGLALTLIITDRSKKSCIAILLLCTVVYAALIPVSPMYKNRHLVSENSGKKQATINALIDEADAARDTEYADLSDEEFRVQRLSGAYEKYLGGLVHKFGLERVVELYNFSEKASYMCNTRQMKTNYCKLLVEDSPMLTSLFGVELSKCSFEDRNYDVENDFHGIYYLCGIVGLLMLAAFLLYFVYRIVKALIIDFKKYFTFETAAWGIAFLMCLAHCYNTASILRRPNASIYFAIVLACIVYLTDDAKRRKNASPKG